MEITLKLRTDVLTLFPAKYVELYLIQVINNKAHFLDNSLPRNTLKFTNHLGNHYISLLNITNPQIKTPDSF